MKSISLKFFAKILRLAAASACATAIIAGGVTAQPPSVTGEMINPANMDLTFNESFKSLDISAYGPGTRWIAHTPWNGDFGSAKFDNPGYQGPFAITKDGLAITARQDQQGKWHAGLLCSMDKIGPTGQGFAQQYGYFEMSAKLPAGPGVWPAFWLIGTDRTYGTAEIDVMEFYGAFNNNYHATEHFWGKFHNSFGKGHKVIVAPGLLSSQYNTYGVSISPQTTTFYFNRQAVWATPTPPEYRQPMYLLVNLALGGGWPIKKLTSPQVMNVQYVRVYQTR